MIRDNLINYSYQLLKACNHSYVILLLVIINFNLDNQSNQCTIIPKNTICFLELSPFPYYKTGMELNS